MKFKLWVKYAGEPDERAWAEAEDRSNVKTLKQAETWGREIIARFNATHYSKHERDREFVRVEMEGASDDHDWEKTNLFTVMARGGGHYDTYKCRVCGITGRRYGLEMSIQRDTKYVGQGYASCEKSVQLMTRKKVRHGQK